VLQRLGATDDELQLRTLLVLGAVTEGRLADAEAELARVDTLDDRDALFGGIAFRQIGHAELALARGDRAAGLRLYRECAAHMGELRIPGIEPTGMEPWAVFGESTALTAHAHHAATADDEEHGRALMRACRQRALRVLDAGNAHLDFPVAGLSLFALGGWGLLRDATPVDEAVELLVIADRFAYNRAIPTMAWERIAPCAEERAPGRIAALRARDGDRGTRELLGAARSVVERLPG
jgi:hypothetical protein